METSPVTEISVAPVRAAYWNAVKPALLWFGTLVLLGMLFMFGAILEKFGIPRGKILLVAALLPFHLLTKFIMLFGMSATASSIIMAFLLLITHSLNITMSMKRIVSRFGAHHPTVCEHKRLIRVASASVILIVLAIETIPWVGIRYLEEVYRDFGVKLPYATKFIINHGNWLRGENIGQVMPAVVYIAVVHLVVTLGVAWCVSRIARSSNFSKRRMPLFVLLIPGVIILLLILVANIIPLYAMAESLQGGKL